MRRLIVLSILSLFLGVMTVTSYAESNTVSVEAGIQFVEDSGSHSEAEASSEKPSTGAGNIPQSEQGTSTAESSENTGSLPKTGEQQRPMYIVFGMICVLIVLIIFTRKKTKDNG